MARLTESDKATIRNCATFAESAEARSPRIVEPTPEARARYCRWASAATKFYRGRKPVRFSGTAWKL